MVSGREILIYLALHYRGDFEQMLRHIQKRDTIPDDETMLSEVSKIKCGALTLLDDDYPETLKSSFKPPLVMFYYGDISLIKDYSKCVTIVGSRDCTEYGYSKSLELASGLADAGYSVVSGLALGIDAAAGVGAVDKMKAVAVLGSGIDYIYPSSNAALYRKIKQKGLILSEYPFRTPPTQESFPRRNRILASLSKATIVGEAAPHSGTLITVQYALSEGRDVAAVPCRPDDQNNFGNTLIKEGASLVENVADALEVLSLK